MSIYSDTAPVSPDFWDPDSPKCEPTWVEDGSDWRARAACLDEDPELFFPLGHGTGAPALAQIEEAKAVCRRCEVREECLEWALEHEDHGVWGGKSEDERRALKRKAGA